MISYQDHKDLPFSAKVLYDIVADVERYPEFLPWCEYVKIKSKEKNIIYAELKAKFGPFQSTYTSKITLQPHSKIAVTLEEGPFNRLQTNWQFEAVDSIKTKVNFNLSFEFKSFFLQQAAKLVFDQVTDDMIQAFERRAHVLNKIKLSM